MTSMQSKPSDIARRIFAMLAAAAMVLIGFSAAASAQPRVPAAAVAAAASECQNAAADTTYCIVQTVGLGGATTGVTRVLTYWHADGSVDGSICVADTNADANGVGVKVNLNAHRTGQPVDNDNSHYVDLGTWKDTGSTCAFNEYNGSNAGGIDFIYINYADSSSACDYCYQGTFTVRIPR